MDYKFTFEDGSEAIAHHGVKGMKWGVWNKDTRARRLGGRRSGIKSLSSNEKKQATLARKTAKELKRAHDSSDWTGKSVELTNDVHARLGAARKKLLDSDPLGKKYYSDPELQRKYKEKYAAELAKKYDDSPEGRESYRRGVLYDDLDQGSMSAFTFESSFDLYVKDNVKNPKAYFAKQNKATEEYRNAVKAEVDKALGAHSNTVYAVNKNGVPGKTIADEISSQSLSRAKDEMISNRNYLNPWEKRN